MRVNFWAIGRRTVQVAVLLLLASPVLGWRGFQGNLGSASLSGILLSDPLAALQVLLLTGALAFPLLAGSASVLAVYGVLGGRSFCGWVCPVGLLTDLSERLPGRRNRPRWRLGWKGGVLALTLLLSLLLGLPVFETLSPIGIAGRALSFGPGAEVILLALIVASELLLVRRLWCRSLCPLGGFYALIGRFSPLKVAYRRERCIHCGRCREVCFVPEVLAPPLEEGATRVKSGECSRCGACIGTCPVAALTLSFSKP
ncbi:ferredoxin-type protein, NapH/MauN family [Desulfuromonas soudanensis]|uniref:Ferredoxin-type protein, NapH/MauN family n=1 Tax=Desulfuromonas soudanensis TaxID=1603606 RepID=A0A0M4D3P0_9BACT|nr:NapH/MauN family ferredoxin-type protein [Desulfuromonas soudanensis]ALC17138.1 ferredoxin-type protein, NapH/MauN family [Desulfuromonas soudanensis]